MRPGGGIPHKRRDGAGADLLEGSEGFDSVTYSGSALGVVVDLAAQTPSGGEAAGNTILGFEHASGGNGDDHLIGDALNNSLSAGAGADTLTGGAGADYPDGGGGSDNLEGGLGGDRFYFRSAAEAARDMEGPQFDRTGGATVRA